MSETLTSTSNQLVLGSTRTVTLTAPTPAISSRTWTIPDITGNGTFVALEGGQTFTGAKVFSASTNFSGSVQVSSGSLSVNNPSPGNDAAIQFFVNPLTNSYTLGIDQSDSEKFKICLGLDLTGPAAFSLNGNGQIANDLSTASSIGINFTDNTTNTVKIKATNSTTSYTLSLPPDDGSPNQYLTTDGSGNTTWTNAAGSGTVNSGTQFQLAYYATSTNAVSGLTLITAARALISDANGLPVAATTTATELGFVHGVTSAIQTQIDSKSPIANPTFTGDVQINSTSVTALQVSGSVNGANPRITTNNTNTTSGQLRTSLLAAGGDNNSVQISIQGGKDASNNEVSLISGSTYLQLGIGGIEYARLTTTSFKPATGVNLNVDNTHLQVGGNQVYPVMQVVQSTTTSTSSTTSASFTNTNLSASITPKFNTSKIKISVTGYGTSGGTGQLNATIARGSTNLLDATNGGAVILGNSSGNIPLVFYDSPATTSATTYNLQIRSTVAGQTVSFPLVGTAVMILEEYAQ